MDFKSIALTTRPRLLNRCSLYCWNIFKPVYSYLIFNNFQDWFWNSESIGWISKLWINFSIHLSIPSDEHHDLCEISCSILEKNNCWIRLTQYNWIHQIKLFKIKYQRIQVFFFFLPARINQAIKILNSIFFVHWTTNYRSKRWWKWSGKPFLILSYLILWKRDWHL